METRQVTLQAPATNTTQNYTVSGFGTAEAAIIMFSEGSTSGAWANNGLLGMGFWDGTNQRCVVAGYDHTDALDGGSGRQGWDPANVVWYLLNGSSANERKASITDTVTDGLELTWTGGDTGSRPRVTVILLKGLNGAQVGFRTASDTDTGTTQTTTTGLTPKLILFAGRLSDSDTSSHGSAPRVTFGFACDNGSTYDNYTHGWYNRHDQNPTDMSGQVRDDACIFLDEALNNYCEVTTMTSGSFTTTSTINGGVFASSHAYLALDFDEDVVGWSDGTPTSDGDWDPYSASFTPQWAFMIPTGFAALNTAYGGDEDGVESHHLYSVNKDGDEDSHNLIVENGSTSTIYAQGQHDTELWIARVSGTPNPEELVTARTPTFDSSGIVYDNLDINTDAGQTHQVVGFFVAETAVDNTNIIVPMGPVR